MMRSLEDLWPLEVAFLFRPAPKSNDFVGFAAVELAVRVRPGRIEWSREELRVFHLLGFEPKNL